MIVRIIRITVPRIFEVAHDVLVFSLYGLVQIDR